ncbi:hypothetical protein D3C87_66640 [compost metagenome]
METLSLIQDIIKSKTVDFRGVPIGSPMDLVLEKEGTPTQINEYSNPFYHYFLEIGEMEELNIYYNYELAEKRVKNVSLYFIHYPDHYWKQAGNSDPIEFWDLLNTNQLQSFSQVFYNTLRDIISFFTTLLNQEPVLSSEYAVPFDAPHNAYQTYKWTGDSHYLTIQTYVDDSIDNNVRNTLILTLRNH